MRTIEQTYTEGGPSLARTSPTDPRVPKGVGGWLLLYVLGRAGLLVHQLQLTVGAILIYVDPEVAGRRTFVSLGAFLFYEVTNWLLVGLTVLAFVLIRRRSPRAIAVNLVLCGLWIVALVVWQFIGLKSPVGTIIDATPAILGLGYFLRSRRVRNTFAHSSGPAALESDS